MRIKKYEELVSDKKNDNNHKSMHNFFISFHVLKFSVLGPFFYLSVFLL